MNQYLDRLNLRPAERRLLLLVLTAVFVALNFWFVWPHFKDWSRLQRETGQAHLKLAQYQAEVERIPAYEARVRQLEGAGAMVIPEEQVNRLISAIQTHASQSRVNYTRIDPRTTRRTPTAATNQFFQEHNVYISFQNTGDKELLEFLLALSTSDLMVRVRDLDVKPDPSAAYSKLSGTMELVASYRKNPTPARATSTAKKP
jgi:hypothetical protein